MKKAIVFFIFFVISAYGLTLTPAGSYHTYGPDGEVIQRWLAAQQVTLTVKKGDTLFITNYVSNWFTNPVDLGSPDYITGFQMDSQKYGYIYAQHNIDGSVSPVGQAHYATGESAKVEWTDGEHSVWTMGYILNDFEKDGEVYLIMTPNGYNETIDTHQKVSDPPKVETALASRLLNYVDVAGNIRVNLGTIDGVAHEFVIGRPKNEVSGQPLPGIMASIALVTVTLGSVSKRKKE